MSRFDVHKDREGHVKINPSWILQLGIAIMLSIVGYFLDGSLKEIKEEMTLARIERAQLRADLTAFEIGAAGDRFTLSDWTEERKELETILDDIRVRLIELETER